MTSNYKPLGVTGCFLLATCARQAPGSLRLLEKLPLHVRFQPSSFVVYRKAGKFRPGMKRQREVFMQSRMKNIVTLVPEAMQALHRLKASAEKGGVPARTLDLIELRASQINGCSVCVDMHARDLKKKGETDERLFAVAAWRDAPYFSGGISLVVSGTDATDHAKVDGLEKFTREKRSYQTTRRPAGRNGQGCPRKNEDCNRWTVRRSQGLHPRLHDRQRQRRAAGDRV